VIVIRHPKEGIARFAAEISENPVINGGDGANQHPTQTLIDLFSIRKFKEKIENLNITLLGDLKHARVIKSLAYGLAVFGVNLTVVSPVGLELEKEIVDELKEKFGIKIIQTNDIYASIRNADVLYASRIQKERFVDPYEAEKMQKAYKITPELLEQGKDGLIIMHALPRVDEIDPRVDQTKFAKYFEEAAFGVPVRMAIIDLVVQ
jgi:aspartate carbamoyltransferase catalytic subunit